jgi:hypothetical protein
MGYLHPDLSTRHHGERYGGKPDHDPCGERETPIITRPQPANFNYDQSNIEITSSSYLIIGACVSRAVTVG